MGDLKFLRRKTKLDLQTSCTDLAYKAYTWSSLGPSTKTRPKVRNAQNLPFGPLEGGIFKVVSGTSHLCQSRAKHSKTRRFFKNYDDPLKYLIHLKWIHKTSVDHPWIIWDNFQKIGKKKFSAPREWHIFSIFSALWRPLDMKISHSRAQIYL